MIRKELFCALPHAPQGEGEHRVLSEGIRPPAVEGVAEGPERHKEDRRTGGNVAAAKAVGKMIAERAKAKGVTKVVFDRGGYIYHGRLKALADAAREAGLQF